jgi:predicted short-subunit dehydrogenase-like oxidoreductase (DUF2520 family)
MIDHIVIIGNGKVGGALYKRLHEKTDDVLVVGHVEFETWLTSSNVIRTNVNAAPAVVVLAVPEATIKGTAQRIANATLTASHQIMDRPPDEDGPQDGILILHTNGSKSNRSLAPLHSAGFLTAAAHPFQTFPNDDPTALDGIAWGVDCEDEAWALCEEFIRLTGGNAVRLSNQTRERRRAYHASAVAASNLTYAAYELARRISHDAGIDASQFLLPIMKRTFENAAKAIAADEAFSITGPLVRGDVDSVQKQVMSLSEELRRPYALMSICLLDTINHNQETQAAMRKMLEGFIAVPEFSSP